MSLQTYMTDFFFFWKSMGLNVVLDPFGFLYMDQNHSSKYIFWNTTRANKWLNDESKKKKNPTNPFTIILLYNQTSQA